MVHPRHSAKTCGRQDPASSLGREDSGVHEPGKCGRVQIVQIKCGEKIPQTVPAEGAPGLLSGLSVYLRLTSPCNLTQNEKSGLKVTQGPQLSRQMGPVQDHDVGL